MHPEFYVPLIPSYLPSPEVINILSGLVEVVLAIGVVIPRFRRASVYLIILMLIAFIPSHVYFIQEGACMNEQSLLIDPLVKKRCLLFIRCLKESLHM